MLYSEDPKLVSPQFFLPPLRMMGQRLQQLGACIHPSGQESPQACISNKAQRILLKNYVKEQAKLLFRINPSFFGPANPTKGVSELVLHPAIDWETPGFTPAIRDTAAAFESDFLKEYSIQAFPMLSYPPPSGEVGRIVADYMVRLKERYHEMKDASLKKLSASEKPKRKRARRHYRFLRRSGLLEQHRLPTGDKETLQLLGIDGMSSDDSEGEIRTKERRLFVRTLPWRNPVITKWLHAIDSLPNYGTANLNNRNYPCIERLLGSRTTDRSPCPRLPRLLYSEAWILQQSQATMEKLQISIASLRLPVIPDFAMGLPSMGEVSARREDEMQDVQKHPWNTRTFFVEANDARDVGEVPTSTSYQGLAVDFDFVSSSETLEAPPKLQTSQLFGVMPSSTGLPRILENSVILTPQAQLINSPPSREYTGIQPSRTTVSPSNPKPSRRRQKRSLDIIHPAVVPTEFVLDQEVYELINTAHFERFPLSMPRTRGTRGRHLGYYKALSDSEESNSDSIDSSDEWKPKA